MRSASSAFAAPLTSGLSRHVLHPTRLGQSVCEGADASTAQAGVGLVDNERVGLPDVGSRVFETVAGKR